MDNEGTQESVHLMAKGAGYSRWGNTRGLHHQVLGIWVITPGHRVQPRCQAVSRLRGTRLTTQLTTSIDSGPRIQGRDASHPRSQGD
jgi:hypothetical protein